MPPQDNLFNHCGYLANRNFQLINVLVADQANDDK